jgi:branched-chain amino acid transport system substrate-binding protein
MSHEAFKRQRRALVQAASASGLSLAVPTLGFAQSGKALKIGYVSPQTGPLAPFGEADKWVIGGIAAGLKEGLTIGGRKHAVSVVLKDSQSNPNRAGEVANDLILKDKVDLVLVSSTPETTNPVSDACELNEVPCVSTVAPWQPWFFGRKGSPDKGFQWTYHFFWGLEDVIAVFTNLWDQVPTNKKVGGLFPNDGDGNAWGDKELGFPKPLAAKGFTLVDPGRYQNLTQDFSAQISAFKRENAEIVTGVVIPPDMKTFLAQSRQQGLRPKIMSVGKALLFPGAIEALGELGDGLSTEVWWTPSHPFKSSIDGMSAKQVAEKYEADTKKQWTQPIGFSHALFEVGLDALGRAKDVGSRQAIRDAVAATSLETIVGPVKWGGKGPFRTCRRRPWSAGSGSRAPGTGTTWWWSTTGPRLPSPTGGKLRPIA